MGGDSRLLLQVTGEESHGAVTVISGIVHSGGPPLHVHDAEDEVVIVLEGELDLWVGDEHFHLEEGDAVTHSSRVPHRNTNNGARPARILFCSTPPSY